jgi:hypothetical protein
MLFLLHSDSKRPRTMNFNDSHLRLLKSSSSFDTETFLRDFVNFTMPSHDPRDVQNRFIVKGVTLCKDSQVNGTSFQPEHEFILIELTDTRGIGSDSFIIVLERTSPGEYSPSNSLKRSIAKSVTQTLRENISKLISSDRRYQAVSQDDSSFELSSFDSPRTLPSRSSASLSFMDKATVAISKSAAASSSSVVGRADDRFIGSKNFEHYATSNRNIRQLVPTGLSLFDLAVLADTVHEYAPSYSPTLHQCFWYSSVICHVIIRLYNCATVDSEAKANSSSNENSVPNNNYLPDLEGTWMGIRIQFVDEEVLSTIISNFRERLLEKEEEVRFLKNP